MKQRDTAEYDRVLEGRDIALLLFFSFILFGYSMVGGRPLTMHEAVLPQSACEMLADGDWVVPKSGGRPWLERPPLPQWITVATAAALGTCAKEWVVRLPSTLIATGVVILLSRMTTMWFSRMVGLLSGLLLATMFEFTRYAWLAEADIYLCGIVTATIAVFVQLEFFRAIAADEPQQFAGGRPPLVWLFFILLGMTNLAKGLLFGTVMVLAPIVGFLLWNGNRVHSARYLWLWGWLGFVLIAGAWPFAAWLRHPDVLELWWFDLGGRLSGNYTAINQPFWYYPVTLAWTTQPWTIPAILGLATTWKPARDRSHSAERFLWCWALLPPVLFSLASGKHHHYLLQCLAPWSVLGALGLIRLRDNILTIPKWKQTTVFTWWVLGIVGTMAIWWIRARVPGPDWALWALMFIWIATAGAIVWALRQERLYRAMILFFGALVTIYTLGHTYAARISDQGLADTIFLKEVPTRITTGSSLVVNADLSSMDVFRILFYLRGLGDQVMPVHNLTFLLDEQIRNESVYLISRKKDFPKLQKYGTSVILLESSYARRETSPGDRFALFHLNFHNNLQRHPPPPYISPMQAMGREPGPFIGNP